MSKRFLIALDLDGTLLKDDKTISERTKKVLDQVQKEGHIVMISTGRPYRASELYYKQLNLTTPIVNFNGGETRDRDRRHRRDRSAAGVPRQRLHHFPASRQQGRGGGDAGGAEGARGRAAAAGRHVLALHHCGRGRPRRGLDPAAGYRLDGGGG